MFHLVPYLNVLENIMLGAVALPSDTSAGELLIEKLGLEHRLRHRPEQLSVGECQRVAVARALISQPSILLADEPTGNLDAENAKIVIRAFQDYCSKGGVLLLATHSKKPIECANRLLTIDSGVVQEQAVETRYNNQ